MNPIQNQPNSNTVFNRNDAHALIEEQKILINDKMIGAIIAAGRTKHNGFKTLAQTRILTTLQTDLEESDQVIQLIYHRLFEAAWNHLTLTSQTFIQAIPKMNSQMVDPLAGTKFLGTLVYDAIANLQEERPEAFANPEAWE